MRAIIVKMNYGINGNRNYSARANGLPSMRAQGQGYSTGKADRMALVKRYVAKLNDWPTEWIGYTVDETTWAYVPAIHADSE